MPFDMRLRLQIEMYASETPCYPWKCAQCEGYPGRQPSRITNRSKLLYDSLETSFQAVVRQLGNN
eukprot:11377987-Alexandrium_andersonii.AAC.1